MNILILVEAFMPSKISAATMMYDLSKEFIKEGHTVYVVSFINKEEVKTGESIIFENYEGIKVIRVISENKKKMSLIKRGLEEVTSAYTLYNKTKKYLNIKFDLIVEYSPNIMLSVFMKKIKKRDNAKSYLVLRDIFPAWAKDLGVIKNDIVYSYFRYIEKKMYENSDIIGVQSPKNKEYLLKENKLENDKVEVLYNWININVDIKEAEDYRAKMGLDNNVIFLYGGNIGKAQDLEFLLECAKELECNEVIKILIVGDGVEKEKLAKKYQNAKNVIFMESLEPRKYIELVKQCDVGLVNLNRNFNTHNIPGKVNTYWAFSKPILAAVNENNDLIDMLNQKNTGIAILTGDMKKYIEAFNSLTNNSEIRREMGLNGERVNEEIFNVKQARTKILERIK